MGNIEATWTKLPKEEQYEVYRTLEEVQKKDWKQLSVDEKKACEYAEVWHRRIGGRAGEVVVLRGEGCRSGGEWDDRSATMDACHPGLQPISRKKSGLA